MQPTTVFEASSSICALAGDGIENCRERARDTSEAFHDASTKYIFIYVAGD